SRAWWMIDLERVERDIATGSPGDRSGEIPAELAERRAQIAAMLDEAQARLGVPAGQLVLGGFSQVAMLACDVALAAERPLAGLVLLSGTLLAAEQWIPAMPRRSGLPVFQSHGRSDAL